MDRMLAAAALVVMLLRPVGFDPRVHSASVIDRIVVSFSSECCGPDNDAMQRVDQVLERFERRHKTRLRIEKAHWGREGEIDYCLDLSAVANQLSEELLESIRAQTNGARLVTVTVNGECHKGR